MKPAHPLSTVNASKHVYRKDHLLLLLLLGNYSQDDDIVKCRLLNTCPSHIKVQFYTNVYVTVAADAM